MNNLKTYYPEGVKILRQREDFRSFALNGKYIGDAERGCNSEGRWLARGLNGKGEFFSKLFDACNHLINNQS